MSVLTSYSQDFFTPKLIVAARIMVLLSILSLMICVPVLNQTNWLAILCILLSGKWLMDWKVLLNDKIILVGIVLVLLFTASLFYSHGNMHNSLWAWSKYLKILYLLFFLTLFTEEKMRKQAVYILIASVMLNEIFVYLHYFKIFTFVDTPRHWLFVPDIPASFIVSFVCYLLANFAFDHKKYRSLFIGCFVVVSFDVLFLNIERTGYIIYLALAALFLLQHFKWKGLISALIAIPLLLGTLYVSSHAFHNRINQAVSNLSDYHHGNPVTSIGLRLSFAKYSFKILQGHWLNGTGVGSFKESYQALNAPREEGARTWPSDPHNEYINILLQTGIIGLVIFLFWLYLQVQVSFKLPDFEKFSLQALILGFMLLSFCNASLLVHPAGACYLIFLAVFLASRYDKTKGLTCG